MIDQSSLFPISDIPLFDFQKGEKTPSTLGFTEGEADFLKNPDFNVDTCFKIQEHIWILQQLKIPHNKVIELLHTTRMIEEKYSNPKYLRNTETGALTGNPVSPSYHVIGTANLALKLFDSFECSCEAKDGFSAEEVAYVGLFHDFIEDGLGDLFKIIKYLNLSTSLPIKSIEKICSALLCLTREKDEGGVPIISDTEYIKNIKKNKLAWLIKVADFFNNGLSSHYVETKSDQKNKSRQQKNLSYLENGLLNLRPDLKDLIPEEIFARVFDANGYLKNKIIESLNFIDGTVDDWVKTIQERIKLLHTPPQSPCFRT